MTSTLHSASYQVVREASLTDVQEELIAVFNATRSRRADAARFEWLYDRNPAGRAVIWSIRRTDTGEMAGFTACLPRRMRVNGSEWLAWIGSDFSILPTYRTLGLALQLRRAARDAIDRNEAEMLYAHPNDRMALIHQRVGHTQVGMMQRFARVLRTRPILEERLQSPILSRIGAAVLDPALRLADPELRSHRRTTIRRQASAVFGEQFDQLFDEACPKDAIAGCRSSQYLNWRYGENPLETSRVLTACDRQRLCGYLIYVVADNSIAIKDIFPATPSVVRDLLAETTRIGREMRLRSATFTLLDSHPVCKTLTSWGFRERAERSQMFAYIPPRKCGEAQLPDARKWHITVGDRDV